MWMTRKCFHLWWLEPWSARSCAHEKVYCALFRKCILCTPPVAFSELRLTGRENASNLKTKSGWQSEVADLIVNVFLKYPNQVSLSYFVLQELLHRSPLVWPLIILSTMLLLSIPSRRPRAWAPPGCRRPLRRGWWGWEFNFRLPIPSIREF